MISNFPISETFKDIVERVSDKLVPSLQAYDPNITKVHYQYGHILEILKTLRQKSVTSTNQNDKYPLVTLLEDIDYRRGIGYGREEWDGTTYLDIVILYQTKKDFYSSEREEKTFNPVLYPIYTALLEEICDQKGFVLSPNPKHLQHTATPRKYWGTHYITVQEKGQKDRGVKESIFNDHLDAIDITGLRITFNNQNCELINNKLNL